MTSDSVSYISSTYVHYKLYSLGLLYYIHDSRYTIVVDVHIPMRGMGSFCSRLRRVFLNTVSVYCTYVHMFVRRKVPVVRTVGIYSREVRT